ncbi:Mov34/MPN/PAD-1 family protein [Mycobacterium sp. SA01]|uniref:Mov34/MPN/PAD-1 family protein n=1 Tax=Mycobacterium sp. SA01 TaxID=3238820 RepID=UPI00351B36DA
MTVHRHTPLPVAPARGRLLVAEQVIEPTTRALRSSRGPDGPHEGLVLWLGRTVGSTSIVMAMVCPDARTGPDYVLLDEPAVAATSRTARNFGLGVIAQVHSHPGTDTRHSDGDDQLILMPFEGMFSLVVATYGASVIAAGNGVGLHQYQNGQWVQVQGDDTMVIVPATAHAPTHEQGARR